MTISHEVDKTELIEKVAEELKKNNNITPPEWATWAKTGVCRERAPARDDWWYVRAAAVLCKVDSLGPIGVSKLRTKYGGKQRRGHKPAHFKKGGGNIIRKVLQQLEKAELIKKAAVKGHKGRVIAPKGKSLLDKAATQIVGEKPKPVKKEAPKKKETKPKPEPKPEKKVEDAAKAKKPVKIELKEKINEEDIKKTEEIVDKIKKEQAEKK